MFYVAEALLEDKELSFSKHSAVIAAFGQHYAMEGKVPVEVHRYFLEAQDLSRYFREEVLASAAVQYASER
jgi:uncharacterized protein (UPF0332 family)